MQPASQMSPRERSAIAVREFRKMIPSLTTFVRAVTGKRHMSVEMSSQSGTDGRKVYIRPPMALAESAIHQRSVCDVREGNRLICPACNRLEEIYVVIYHEVSHNVAGSMKKLEESELRTIAIQSASDHGSPEYLEFIKASAYSITGGIGTFDVYDYGCNLTDYLLGFVRAIDDYRIDKAAYAARPGVEIMRYNQTEIILDKGLEFPDGRVQLWSDAPIEAQIPIAILVGKQGHDISEPRFDGRIAELFEMPVIKSLINEPVPDVKSVLHLSVAFLGELNKLGLYDLPLPDVQPPPFSSFEDGELDDSQGGSGDSGDDSDESENAGTVNSSGSGSGNKSDPDDSEPDSDNDNGDDSGGVEDSDSDDSAGDESGSREDGKESDADAGSTGEDSIIETGESGSDNEDQHGTPSIGIDGGDRNHVGNGESPVHNDLDKHDEGSEGNSPVDSRSQGDDDDSEEEDFQGDSGNVAEIVGSTDQVPDFSDIDHVSAEEINEAIEQASGHSSAEVIIGAPRNSSDIHYHPEDPMENAVRKALVFDDANTAVVGLVVHEGGKGGRWNSRGSHRSAYDFSPIDRSILSPSILHARRIFNDSKLDKTVPNLKKGKLATAKLGTRAWNRDDDRLFKRKIRADGIDDELLIAMDLSGSTGYRWNRLIKEAAHAMADVAASVGVKFTICGHTTQTGQRGALTQVIYTVKKVSDPWGPSQKKSLALLGAIDGSLDGHNFEYYRKVLQRSQARRKTLIYFTDGQIPETNHNEEVVIIARELKLYKQLGFGILVVAFGTDGPKNYGLDTIRIDSSGDILTVVRELDSRLTH